MEIRVYQTYNEAEILNLYQSVGWTAYTKDPAALQAGFHGSLLTLAAYEKTELLGLIRTVGDGQTIVYIQDLLVLPAYQRRGIGTALVRAVLARFPSVRQIVLTTDDSPVKDWRTSQAAFSISALKIPTPKEKWKARQKV